MGHECMYGSGWIWVVLVRWDRYRSIRSVSLPLQAPSWRVRLNNSRRPLSSLLVVVHKPNHNHIPRNEQ